LQNGSASFSPAGHLAVPYTSIIGGLQMSVFHAHFGVVARSKGNSASKRFAYQQLSPPHSFEIGSDRVRCEFPTYGGRGLLLPSSAPDRFADCTAILSEIAAIERRHDAQEGFRIDFSLPRQVQPADQLPAAGFVLSYFAARGMAVVFDVHSPIGSDRRPQPHVHAWVAQRPLTEAGFGSKRRDWNALMRKHNGQFVRALVAGRLNLFGALRGIAFDLDHRSNARRQRPAPEQRIPRSHWEQWKRGKKVPLVDAIRARRNRGPKAFENVDPKPLGTQGNTEKPEGYTASTRSRRVVRPPWSIATNIATHPVRAYFESGHIELSGIDGCFLYRPAAIEPRSVCCLVELAVLLGWPALIVEGDQKFIDAVALAAARHPTGLGLIGARPSDQALSLIANGGAGTIAGTIHPFDWSGLCEAYLGGFTCRNDDLEFGNTVTAGMLGHDVEETPIEAQYTATVAFEIAILDTEATLRCSIRRIIQQDGRASLDPSSARPEIGSGHEATGEAIRLIDFHLGNSTEAEAMLDVGRLLASSTISRVDEDLNENVGAVEDGEVFEELLMHEARMAANGEQDDTTQDDKNDDPSPDDEQNEDDDPDLDIASDNRNNFDDEFDL
jgi:hypothetical protein